MTDPRVSVVLERLGKCALFGRGAVPIEATNALLLCAKALARLHKENEITAANGHYAEADAALEALVELMEEEKS